MTEFLSDKMYYDDMIFLSTSQRVNVGFKIGDIPLPVKHFEEANSINFSRSLVYDISTVILAANYILTRFKK